MEIVKSLTDVVGKGNVSEAPEKLKAYSKDTSLESPKKPNYVVSVKNKEQVQKIVELANKTKMPVYPVSSGVHFYGNTHAPARTARMFGESRDPTGSSST